MLLFITLFITQHINSAHMLNVLYFFTYFFKTIWYKSDGLPKVLTYLFEKSKIRKIKSHK